MVQTTVDNGLPRHYLPDLNKMEHEYTDIFRTSFSCGPPAETPPLRIELVPEAKPVRVLLLHYSQEQRDLLFDMVQNLVSCGMVYPNPSSPWA